MSLVATLAAVLLLLPALAVMVTPGGVGSRLEAVDEPERALARVVGRTMDLREAVARAAGWQRWMAMALGLEDPDDVDQAIRWYEELAGHSFDPRVDLHLAIVEAETGRLSAVRRRISEWAQRGEPLPTFATVLAVAYFDVRSPVAVPPHALDEWVQEAWFRDRLALALARRTNDGDARAQATARLVRRGDAVLARLEVMAAVTLCVALGGMALAILVARRRRRDSDALVTGTAPMPPPWSGPDGAAVLVRGGALSIGVLVDLMLVLGFTGVSGRLPALWVGLLDVPTGLLILVPTLLLARRHLFRPAGLSVADALGLRVVPGGARRVALVTMLVVGVAAAGDVVLGFAAGALGATGHWTEWFDSALVFGGPLAALGSVGETVVVAAVSEEVLFRGLLFAVLRRRLGWMPAGLLSALAFAALHGYTGHGFASVAWSGLVWAWAYERSRSLWPILIGHALGNLAASTVLLLALRG